MTCPSQSPRLNHPDYIRWTIQSMKFLIVSLLLDIIYCNVYSEFAGIRRPWWSWGKVLVSRSMVRSFKPGYARWIFLGPKSPEHHSFGSDIKRRSRVWYLKVVKGPQAWKQGFWSIFNRHIHGLALPWFPSKYILILFSIALPLVENSVIKFKYIAVIGLEVTYSPRGSSFAGLNPI